MNKIRIKSRLTLLTIIVLLSSISLTSDINFAADVSVTLPTFDVTINGIKVENQFRKYPFIVYKNITYFPMTYRDSRFLALETKWDNKSGLEIVMNNELSFPEELIPDMQTYANKSRYTAGVPTFNIKVNGTSIDNRTEPYPLLLFRNITYFPLTWRFAVDEFNWDYLFQQNTGLSIIAHFLDNSVPPIDPFNKYYTLGENIKIELRNNKMAMPDNMVISIDGGKFTKLGDPNYMYGVVGYITENASSLQSSDYIELKDGYLYINAIDFRIVGESHVYKIELSTGEISLVTK